MDEIFSIQYLYPGIISLFVSFITTYLISFVRGLWNVRKFKQMYLRVYINHLIEQIKLFDPSKGINDLETSNLANKYVKRIKYSFENELNRLNASYAFRIIRISEYTLSDLKKVIDLSQEYEFTDLNQGGQKKEFLEDKKSKILEILNDWEKNVKDYYTLKTD